jgi:hypothetical protein
MDQLKRWAALAVVFTSVVPLAVPALAGASTVGSSKGVLAPIGPIITATVAIGK